MKSNSSDEDRPESENPTLPGSDVVGPDTTTFPSRLSIVPKDLLADKLLLAAPRIEVEGQMYPALGGIPLLAKLGQGGMGAVYFGVHLRLKKELAVKVLSFHLADQQPELIPRFYREAQMAAQIQSPHLVEVVDINEENGLYYLLMEFVSGMSASAYLKKICAQGNLGVELPVALDVCIGAAKGLSVAHQKGIVHRDIKPDNIMLPDGGAGTGLRFGDAKVADLGLARSDESGNSLTGSQVAMGTPGYMSPEQIMDVKSARQPTDVFGLGATLYALLCGEAPFTGTSVTKVIFDTVQKSHPPIQDVRAGIPENVIMLIDRCLKKNPDERYPDATALLAELIQCRNSCGDATESAPPTLVGAGAINTSRPEKPIGKSKTHSSTGVEDPVERGQARLSESPDAKASGGSIKFVVGSLVLVSVLLLSGLGYHYGVFGGQEDKRSRQGADFKGDLADVLAGIPRELHSVKKIEISLKKLDEIKRKYPNKPEAKWTHWQKVYEGLSANLKLMQAQEALALEIAKNIELAKDPLKLEVAVKSLEALKSTYGATTGLDLSALHPALERLEHERKQFVIERAVLRAREVENSPEGWRKEIKTLAKLRASFEGMAGLNWKEMERVQIRIQGLLGDEAILDEIRAVKKDVALKMKSNDEVEWQLAQGKIVELENKYGAQKSDALKELRVLAGELKHRIAVSGLSVGLEKAQGQKRDLAGLAVSRKILINLLTAHASLPPKDLAPARNYLQVVVKAFDDLKLSKEKFDMLVSEMKRNLRTSPVEASRTLDLIVTLLQENRNAGFPDWGKLLKPSVKELRVTIKTDLADKAEQQLRKEFYERFKAAGDAKRAGNWTLVRSVLEGSLKKLGPRAHEKKVEAEALLSVAKQEIQKQGVFQLAMKNAEQAAAQGKWKIALDLYLNANRIKPNVKAVLAGIARARQGLIAAKPKIVFGPAKAFGPFGVYANRPAQGVPLDRNGKVVPLRTDLDKEQFAEAMRPVREALVIEKGSRVHIVAEGLWYSGPTGKWVHADGRSPKGEGTLKQYRAFQGSKNEFMIATLVAYIFDKKKPGKKDFTALEKKGHAWGCTDRKKPIEFIMPATGILRFQQNRSGYYDVTQGAVSITVTVSPPSKK